MKTKPIKRKTFFSMKSSSMKKEIKSLIKKLENNFIVNRCNGFEPTCPDCRATFILKELNWLLTLEN